MIGKFGIICEGVWPESKSFSDEGYGPVPSKWRGICQTDSTFHCNRFHPNFNFHIYFHSKFTNNNKNYYNFMQIQPN